MSGINWESGDDISVQVNQRALIDKILARYSGEFTIFRELLQNADDADASTVKIRFTTCKNADSSALDLGDLKNTLISRYELLNDGIPFREQDWDRLRKIAEGNPNEQNVGAFGVGFYSLFSVTEQPMVVSGNKWMGFYWKDGGDQLFARTGERNVHSDPPTTEEPTATSSTGNPWTSFTMDLRTPTPLDQPLDFARFLITALTFMQTMRRIEMYVDDWEMLTIDKQIGVTEGIAVPGEKPRELSGRGFFKSVTSLTKDPGSTSPGGIMYVHNVNSTTVRISASVMRALLHSGYTPPPLPPVPIQPKSTIQHSGGWGAMLQSASSLWSRSATPSQHASIQCEAPTTVAKPTTLNLEEKVQATRTIRVIGTEVDCTVAGQFAIELERATKKAAPRRTKVQLIYSEAHEEEEGTAEKDSQGGPTAGSIFSGIQPPLHSPGNSAGATSTSGRIFIGQPTAQTTGLGGHISARFIPTVERESVDLQDRWVSIWNKELLWVAGWLARGTYAAEMDRLKREWLNHPSSGAGTGGEDDSTMLSAETTKLREKITKQAVHLLRFFTFHPSTPSGLVSTHIESAFFATHSSAPLGVISTRGPLHVSSVRMPHPQLTPWLGSLPVLVPELADRADEELMVARLRERGLLKDIGLDDVVDALERSPLDEEQAVGLIKWWISMTKVPAFDGRLRSKVMNAAVLRIVDAGSSIHTERILRLADIKSWLNPATIPADMPLSDQTLPYTITKRLGGNSSELAFAFDWHELSVIEWVQYLVSVAQTDTEDIPLTDKTETKHDLIHSAPFVEKVLATVARSWNRLNAYDKETLKTSMNTISCLPTRRGFAKPQDSYFSDVDLFPDLAIIDLPSLAIKGPLRAMLTAMGVRSHVDLQLVFSRLVGNQKWSCYELVRYLVSVRSTLTDLEMARLKKTQAFPVLPRGESSSPDSGEKIVRRTPDMLYEPSEEHKELGVEVLDWGHAWKASSPEAQFAFSLGVKRHVSLPTLLEVASHPSDGKRRKAAFSYLLKNLTRYVGFNSTAYPDFAFVPAISPTNGDSYLARPTEVFTNSAATVLGFATVDTRQVSEDVAAKLKLHKDPPVSEVARRVIDSPPLDVEQCIKYLEYMSSRLGDFYRDPHKSLSKLSNIPFVRVRDTRNPGLTSTILCRPNEIFFRPDDDSSTSSNLYSIYQRVFLYVNYGQSANAFLDACGVKRQPSIEQLAGLIVADPSKFLRLAQTKELYLAQLRILAASYSSFATDLKRQMVRSAFLLASKHVTNAASSHKQPLGNSSKVNLDLEDEDMGAILEFDLAAAKEICIIDDPNAYSIFGNDIRAAPQEDMLEEFYMKLGSQPLSGLIKEEYKSSGTPIVSASATSLRRLALERLALFYSDRSKGNAEVSLDWLKKDKNFNVFQVGSINLKRTLKQGGMERTNSQAVSACVVKGRGGVVNLYVSTGVEMDMFEVALALVKALFKKQKAERLAQEADFRDKQEKADLERKAQGKLDEKTKAAAVAQLKDLFPNQDPRHLASVLDSQQSNHLVNATNALLQQDGGRRPSTSSKRDSAELKRSPSIASSSTKLSGTTLMNSLRQKFKPGSGTSTASSSQQGPGSLPQGEGLGQMPSPGQNQSSEVTPFANIRDNALRAVAASRPDMSRDIVSEPQRSTVRESGDTYCDLTGVKTDLTSAGTTHGTLCLFTA
ncbi:hypothetical protein QFC22_004723 [Naganishia vaughanmartiniae]|uniref:Uncharacterized protein n=1 Tax=Naganishia vaughanmartiniae TaxID=1424756 RepID=A0ACC2WXT4_9TREE|nr:hypothetical protein QFC22_004723 [Naganishia vaughanmartiniae]